jgi:hypothetical protein
MKGADLVGEDVGQHCASLPEDRTITGNGCTHRVVYVGVGGDLTER